MYTLAKSICIRNIASNNFFGNVTFSSFVYYNIEG